MTNLERWAKKHYPVLTEKQIKAIREVKQLYTSMAVNAGLRHRRLGKSYANQYFDSLGLELIIEASKDLPLHWTGQKRNPVELDPEYFGKYPSYAIERKRMEDMERYERHMRWLYPEEFKPNALDEFFDRRSSLWKLRKYQDIMMSDHLFGSKIIHPGNEFKKYCLDGIVSNSIPSRRMH